MNPAPPASAPARPRSRQAQKMASWVEAGPGIRLQTAIASSNSVSSSQPLRSTHNCRSSRMCAGGPPNPMTPIRPHSRSTVHSETSGTRSRLRGPGVRVPAGARHGQAGRADVAGPDQARADHLGVDPGAGLRGEAVHGADPVVRGGHPQRAGVARQVAVLQGGDGTARRPRDDADHQVGTDAQVAAGPVVLGEPRRPGADDDVGPVAFELDGPARAERRDPVERRRADQVQRREVDEVAAGGGTAKLADVDAHPRANAPAQHLVRIGPVERRAGRRGGGQRDRLAEELRQGRLDAGVAVSHDGPAGEGDRHRRAGDGGVQREQATPQPRVLRAGDLAGLPVDEAEHTVPGQALRGHLAGRQVLAEHRLDRVAAQHGHRAQAGFRAHRANTTSARPAARGRDPLPWRPGRRQEDAA